MPGRVHLVLRPVAGSPTAAEFGSLLDDIEAAYRLAFWTNRLGGFSIISEERLGSDLSGVGSRQDYVDAEPVPWLLLPPPPTRQELELHTDSLSFGSPFEFLGSIQGLAGMGGLGGILWCFAKNLADLFDVPDRIRLRRIRRERQMYEEALARDKARAAYLAARRRTVRRFELTAGELDGDEDG